MVSVSNTQESPLERWGPSAFIVAGVLFVGHAVVRGIEAFTASVPPADVFGPPAYVVALVGLFGLYPVLADRTPKLARIATVVAAIPALGWLVIAAWSVGEVVAIFPPQSDILPGVFFIVIILSTLLTYVLFGVASLRAEVHSQTVGVLLLAPAGMLVLLIAGVSVLEGSAAVGGFVIGSGQALIHLACGFFLRTGRTTTDHETTSGDLTAN